ncbi:MAG: hypothetical protein Phog2KO_50630 [Phototrophicaceae bacterium]
MLSPMGANIKAYNLLENMLCFDPAKGIGEEMLIGKWHRNTSYLSTSSPRI